MVVKDLFDFLNPDLEKRERYLPLLTDVSTSDDGRRILLHSGFEKHKNIEDLNKDVLSGYYVYYSYAHFDDEIFLWFEDFKSALKEYKKENIHKRPCITMEKRLIRVSGSGIEQLKMDKWKDNK